MERTAQFLSRLGLGSAILAMGCMARTACAQSPAAISVAQLARMSEPELDQLYRGGVAAPIPAGRARGTALFPGASFAAARSQMARLVWQGKVFPAGQATVINRFFGARMIRGNVLTGPSWRDGQPALVIDYQDTSRVYARYRDEVRQIGAGIFLGLMYDRTSSPPSIKRYFVLEAGL
jgi:hypothetical protein